MSRIQTGRNRKTQEEEMVQAGMSEYGKRRLLTYADTFRELAKSMNGEAAVSVGQNRTAQTAAVIEQDRASVFAQHRIQENRQVLCSNLNEMARIMDKVATEVFRLRPFDVKKRKAIAQALKKEGIRVEDLYYIERPGERASVGASLSMRDQRNVTGEQAAAMLSVLLDRRLELSAASPYCLERLPKSFVFVEEAAYVVLSGTARAVKEGEACSGDSFAVMEAENGRVTVLLSDGMGSGEKASQDSEMLLDLLEKFLEAGYQLEEALQLVNGALAAGEAQNMSTLDVCDVDLYSGECKFYKMGAAASFIKRAHGVETVAGESLPLGIFRETEPAAVRRRLMDGEYCILMTDGVLDALKQNRYEETMCQIIESIHEQNPKEIAGRILQFVLHCSGGRIRDDMTVIVLGIWENT